MAIVRAHVTALGGNAMVAYFMNECILINNPHKNQVSCIIYGLQCRLILTVVCDKIKKRILATSTWISMYTYI